MRAERSEKNLVEGWPDEKLRAHVVAVLADPARGFQWACALCCTAVDRGIVQVAAK